MTLDLHRVMLVRHLQDILPNLIQTYYGSDIRSGEFPRHLLINVNVQPDIFAQISTPSIIFCVRTGSMKGLLLIEAFIFLICMLLTNKK